MDSFLETKIVNRAERLNLIETTLADFAMDLNVAIEQFDLDLNRLLTADDLNFSYDVCGIQGNIDRSIPNISGFWPKSARKAR